MPATVKIRSMAEPRSVVRLATEFAYPPDEVGRQVVGVVDRREDLVGVFEHDVGDQRRTAGPPAIDGLLSHTGPGGDRLDGQTVESALEKQLTRGGDDRRP